MPRRRERTTKKGSWTEEQLQSAIAFMREGTTMRKAALKFNIPYTTFVERVKNGKKCNPKLGRNSVFTKEQEKAMSDRILYLSNIFYGLTPLCLRKFAYDFAEKNQIKHNFNHQSKLAGYDWLEGFRKRNPSITIRKPEATSVNRVTAFNREAISLFFDNLENTMDKHHFSPSNIYNVDETGISTVQDTVKILAERGKKRVGNISSWERGKNVTVVCAMSASGSFIPPMFIFPRKRMTPLLEKNGPLGAIYRCSDNGWSNDVLFIVWLEHFIKYSNASADNKVLLILDNHVSHTSLGAYTICRENGITLVSLPPHTSHRTQPLDVSFYGPLKHAFKRKSDEFMKLGSQRGTDSSGIIQITPYDLAGIFSAAYSEVAKIGLAESGFRSTGIFPMNRNIFRDDEFLAAHALTNYPVGSPVVTLDVSDKDSPKGDSPSSALVSIAELLPSPGPLRKKGSARAKQKSEILTATPRKEDLLEKLNKKLEKESKKSIKKPTKRSLSMDYEPSTSRDIEFPNRKKQRVMKKRGENKKEDNARAQKKKVVSRKNKQEAEYSSESDWGDISEGDLVNDDDFDDAGDVSELCFMCQEHEEGSPLWKCRKCSHSCHMMCSMGEPEHGLCDLCHTWL